MMSIIINNIILNMKSVVDSYQLEELKRILTYELEGYRIVKESEMSTIDNSVYIDKFLDSKRIEGCSNKTILYYKNTINKMCQSINKDIKIITTDDLRSHLIALQSGGLSKITIDNVRRVLSSFFTWLEDEDVILKSPVRRIHKVKIEKSIKDVYSDEILEKMRDNIKCIRDLALIDILASTGMRVGELVLLNKEDIDFNERECIVFGKGNKERFVYFDARTKIHLKEYMESRSDNNSALFVSLKSPFKRLTIAGIESRLRKIGVDLNIKDVYPHKFRRTLATNAIDKGMPIEQVQHLLGHQRIDTTLHYAFVKQNNVKNSHKKYIG